MGTDEKRGAGRRPLPEDEKKIRIDIFVEKSIVDSNGGKDALKKVIYYFLGQK